MIDPETTPPAQSDPPPISEEPSSSAAHIESKQQAPKNTKKRSDTVTAGRHVISKRIFFFGFCALAIIVAYCIANADSFATVINRIGEIITPLIIGCVIAYLCNPFLKFYEFVAFRRLKHNAVRRGLSLLCTVLTALGIIAGIIALILPELVASLTQLITNFDTYLDSLLLFIQSVIDKFTANLPEEYRDVIDVSDRQKLTELIEQLFGSVENALSEVLSFLQGFVMDENLLGNVWNFIVELFNVLKNAIIGIFIAFYILSSKEKRIAQLRKFRAAYFTEEQDAKITEFTRLVDRTFGGFIKGVLLDALAVGVVTFILLSIFRVSEYNLLIAAICAITNIIPVFGPFIGAIPSGLIVLISNPSKLLVFSILVVVIQQIDCNILCPRIQGNNTGISSLAVLVAITVMGSLGGIMGMVIGVPIFAVIIELVKRAVETRLVERGVPTDTTHYYPSNAVGNAEEEVYYEHSHLRYLYDHSKLKIHVDRTIAGLGRLFNKKTAAHDPLPADSDADPQADVSIPASDTDNTTSESPENAPPSDASTPEDQEQPVGRA